MSVNKFFPFLVLAACSASDAPSAPDAGRAALPAVRSSFVAAGDALGPRALVRATRNVPHTEGHDLLATQSSDGVHRVLFREQWLGHEPRLAVLDRQGVPVDPYGAEIPFGPQRPTAVSIADVGDELAVAYVADHALYLRFLGPDLRWHSDAITLSAERRWVRPLLVVHEQQLFVVRVPVPGESVQVSGHDLRGSVEWLARDVGIAGHEGVVAATASGPRLFVAWVREESQVRLARVTVHGDVIDPGGWPVGPGNRLEVATTPSGVMLGMRAASGGAATVVRIDHDMNIDPTPTIVPDVVVGAATAGGLRFGGRPGELTAIHDVDAAGALTSVEYAGVGHALGALLPEGDATITLQTPGSAHPQLVQRLHGDGTAEAEARPLRLRQAREELYRIAADEDGFLAIWDDEIAGRWAIGRLDRDGQAVEPPSPMTRDVAELLPRPGGFWARSGGAVAALDAAGTVVGAWHEMGGTDLGGQSLAPREAIALAVWSARGAAYGRRVAATGPVDAAPVALATSVDSRNGELAAAAGDGGWLVAWCEGDSIAIVRVGTDGRPRDQPARVLSIAPSFCQRPPTMVFAGGVHHLFWSGWSDGVWSMRVAADGTATAPALIDPESRAWFAPQAVVLASSIALQVNGSSAAALVRVGFDGASIDGRLALEGGALAVHLVAPGGDRAIVLESDYHPIDGAGPTRIFRRWLDLRAAGACGEGFECASGVCADGVCCDRACGDDPGDCLACSVAAGAAADGVCGVIAAGIECRAAGGACGAAEVCDGVGTACPSDGVADDGTACDDGVACTTGDVCTGGACGGAAVVCEDPGECAAAACNPTTGACDVTPVLSGTPCRGGRCEGGVCVAPDAGVPDAGVPDAGVPDAGVPTTPDAGPRPDAGAIDPPSEDDGCGCSGGRSEGSLAALLLAGAFLARRRARA